VMRAVLVRALQARTGDGGPAAALPRRSGLAAGDLAATVAALPAAPGRGLGVAGWLADGLEAAAFVAARPGLRAAIAGVHHRRAVAAAAPAAVSPRPPAPAPVQGPPRGPADAT